MQRALEVLRWISAYVCEWGEEEGCTCVSGLRWIVNSTDGHLEQLCALQQTHTHIHTPTHGCNINLV